LFFSFLSPKVVAHFQHLFEIGAGLVGVAKLAEGQAAVVVGVGAVGVNPQSLIVVGNGFIVSTLIGISIGPIVERPI
jgi:hypothetical protein